MLLLAAWLFLSFNFILHVPFFSTLPNPPARALVCVCERVYVWHSSAAFRHSRAIFICIAETMWKWNVYIWAMEKHSSYASSDDEKKIYANESERGEHRREKKSQQKCRKQQLNCNSWWRFFCWWNCSVRASFIKAKKHKFSERTCSTRGNKSPAPSYKSKWNSWKCKEASLQTKQLHEST